MTNYLDSFSRANAVTSDMRRFSRVDEYAAQFKMESETVETIAIAAGALYRLPRTLLIKIEKMEEYMKHLYKVPNTSKYVQKKYVRIGEGSIMYSIGHHRFIEMARAAGAVYKINEGTGGTVLISLELFDEYMEQFRTKPVEMKNPLFEGKEPN